MQNNYKRKDHQGNWVDKTPDIWAASYYNGGFLVATKKYGAEADLGQALLESLKRNRSPEGLIITANEFGLEAISRRYVQIAAKNKIDVSIVLTENCKFDGVSFEYEIDQRGKIYVKLVGAEELNKPRIVSKPKDLIKVLAELSKRR